MWIAAIDLVASWAVTVWLISTIHNLRDPAEYTLHALASVAAFFNIAICAAELVPAMPLWLH